MLKRTVHKSHIQITYILYTLHQYLIKQLNPNTTCSAEEEQLKIITSS